MTPPLDPSLFDLQDTTWAMHCAEGPVPRVAVDAARVYLEKELRPWELSYDTWLERPTIVRDEAARLLGARAEDVTLTSSTSAGLTSFAQAFPWEPGDEVLAPLGEFPANIWPWKALAARGVRWREVPLWAGQQAGAGAMDCIPPPPDVEPEEAIACAIGPRTRIVTVSWVRFQDGLRLDLGRLAAACADRGALLVVDGIQGAGTLPLDLSGVSAFATGVHKGLLSPQGAGLLWTAAALRERLAPLGSWLSVEQGSDFSRPSTDHTRAWLDDGCKLELGGYAGLMLAPLGASLRLLRSAGVEAIAAHVHDLQARLIAALASMPAFAAEAERLAALHQKGRLGSIVSLHHGGRGAAWLTALVEQGAKRRIYTSAREGYLRIALHGWHGEADVERLVAWLAAVG